MRPLNLFLILKGQNLKMKQLVIQKLPLTLQLDTTISSYEKKLKVARKKMS